MMARTWNERKFGYFSVQDKNDEIKISEGNSVKTPPVATGIQNFHRAMTPNSGSRGNYMRSTPPPSGIQNVYRTQTPNSASRGSARKGQGVISFFKLRIVISYVFDLFHHFITLAESLLFSRSFSMKFSFVVLLPCVLLLGWKFETLSSVFFLQNSQNAESSLENQNADHTSQQIINWWPEMEKKVQVIMENKWQDLTKQLESKWTPKSQQLELWQNKLLVQFKDITSDSKVLAKEVDQLKFSLQSKLREEKENESLTLENLKNILIRLDRVEEKSKDLKDLILDHKNMCKNQADLRVELSSLVQEMHANCSQLRHLKNPVGSASLDQTNTNAPSLQQVQEIIEMALSRYNSDKTGLVDYALESAGGSIVSVRDTETYSHGSTQFTIFGVPFWKSRNSPRAVIQPPVHPGECWAMRGSRGRIIIRLFASIQPTAFSMEHIPKSLAPMGNIDSAPKEFSVFGLSSDDDEEGSLLGNYTYLQNGESLQTFRVQNSQDATFILIELRVQSNQGNLDYTCIYRFRVHGIQK